MQISRFRIAHLYLGMTLGLLLITAVLAGLALAQAGTRTVLVQLVAAEAMTRELWLMRARLWTACPQIEGLGDRKPPALIFVANAFGHPAADDQRVLQALDLLLDRGCPIDARGSQGLTALHLSALYREPALTRYLLARGADPRTRVVTSEDAAVQGFAGMTARVLARFLVTQPGWQAADRARLKQVIRILNDAESGTAPLKIDCSAAGRLAPAG